MGEGRRSRGKGGMWASWTFCADATKGSGARVLSPQHQLWPFIAVWPDFVPCVIHTVLCCSLADALTMACACCVLVP
jgi:hypothetical protein